jgi:beta-lactamase regulating signal transducer with metallopeptidase domain
MPNTAFGLLVTLASLLTIAAPSSIASLLRVGARGDPSSSGQPELRCLLIPSASDFGLHLVSYGLLLVVLLAAAGGGYALLLDWCRTRRFVQCCLDRRADGLGALERLAEDAGLGGRVDLVRSADPRCFCYGLVRPRVCVTTGLLDALGPAPLEAVLRHEAYHARNYDPLRLILGRVLVSAFFFVPTLRDLFEHYRLHIELVADKEAVRQMGEPESLAAALDTLLDAGVAGPAAVPGVAHDNSLELRIDSLLGEPVRASVGTRTRLGLSVLLVLLVAAPALAPLVAGERELLAALASTPHAAC